MTKKTTYDIFIGMNVKDLLYHERTKRRVLQKDLAREMNITSVYYSMIETGVRNPGISLLAEICHKLCIPAEKMALAIRQTETEHGQARGEVKAKQFIALSTKKEE